MNVIYRQGRVGLLIASVFTLALNTLPAPLFASSGDTAAISPWLVGDPTLGTSNLLPDDQLVPYSINYNRDCSPRRVITRPKLLLPELSRDGCVVDTAFGAYDKSGLLQRTGTTVSGPIAINLGGSFALIPIPRSTDALLSTGSSSYGTYFSFTNDLGKHIHSLAALDGSVSHSIDNSLPLTQLADRSGVPISVTYDSLSFSSNGEWMIADSPGIGFVRVNTLTREVLPFSDPTNYSNALAPGYQTAISPDGRYAVVASNTYSRFKLYDLSTCALPPDHITTKVACQSKSLYEFMQASAPGFLTVMSIRFRGDNALDLYDVYKTSGVAHRAHTNLIAAGQSISGFDYLGLGDSFASGEGAYQYKAMTDTADNKCHLSLRSYPYLMAAQLGFSQYESLACSGAKINDVLSAPDTKNWEPQASGKGNDSFEAEIMSGFEPGYRPQESFVDKYSPNTITISTVGNDIGFADIIKRCVSTDMCYGFYEERVDLLHSIDGQFDQLAKMYNDLVNASVPGTRIYAIGYPKVADPDGNCADNVHLSHEELQFANDLTDYLNAMIKRAADRAGVYYVDTSDALTGHRLCETNSWEVAVNGLTAGKDVRAFHIVPLPIGNESFHPNAFGQDLMKTAILAKTNNLAAQMPDAQPALTQPKPTDDLPILKDAPKSHDKQRMRIFADAMGNDVAYENQPWDGTAGTDIPLAPDATAEVWIHSTPVKLGTFTTSATGTLDFSITPPENLEPGFHTLTVYTKNVAGEDISLEKVIYVATSADDFDGNGITDDQDACPSIIQSEHDTDQDGIDDACDGIIGETPPPPPPAPALPEPIIETPPVIPPEPILQPTEPPQESIPPAITEPPVIEPTPPVEIKETPMPPAVTIVESGESPPVIVIEQPPEESLPAVVESTSTDKEIPLHESNPWETFVIAVEPPITSITPTDTPVIPTTEDTRIVQPSKAVLGAEAAHALKSAASIPQRKITNKKPTTYLIVGVIWVFGWFVLWRFKRQA